MAGVHLIAQSSLGAGDSAASLSQLEQDELSRGANLWQQSSGHRGPDGSNSKGSLSDLSAKMQQLQEALQSVSELVRDAQAATAAAEEEACSWKQKYQLQCRKRRLAEQQSQDSVPDTLYSVVVPPLSSAEGQEDGSSGAGAEQAGGGEREESRSGGLPASEASLPSPATPCSAAGRDEVCTHRILQNVQPQGYRDEYSGHGEVELGDGDDKKAGRSSKVPFRLEWGPAGQSARRHKHDIVSFEGGSISTVVRGSKQINLLWERPPSRVLIINKPGSPPVRDLCAAMVRWLGAQHGTAAVLEPKVRQELLEMSGEFESTETWGSEDELLVLHLRVDLCITLGGDGTVLWAANMFRGPVPPLVSFACGSLGFMTPFPSDDFQSTLSKVLRGPLCITLRNRLRARIIRRGAQGREASADMRSAPSLDDKLVLNEVAIDRGMSSALTHLECFCDGLFVTLVQGDGLILSTTSGSTAYSLAAGGSMVHPQVPGILFTPICPHSLSFRPLILPEYVTLRVQVPEGRIAAWVSFDGKDRQALEPGDALAVQMSIWPVPTVCDLESTSDFFRGIQDGLHWNMRKPQG